MAKNKYGKSPSQANAPQDAPELEPEIDEDEAAEDLARAESDPIPATHVQPDETAGQPIVALIHILEREAVVLARAAEHDGSAALHTLALRFSLMKDALADAVKVTEGALKDHLAKILASL
jgi:hypothetical protein